MPASKKRHATDRSAPSTAARAPAGPAAPAGLPAMSGEFDIGERLREIRERYGFSQRALAARADVTNGMISMIEKNRSSPSVATLKKILNGFPMSLAEFFAVGAPQQPKMFFAAAELVEIAGGPISYRQVGANLDGKALQIIHEQLLPGADTGADMLRHEAEEGGIVIRGEIEVTVGMQSRILRAGDAYYFSSRIPHRFRNVGGEPCEVVSACTPPSF
jgi:transcriptional regulator with XRE-family HTH domain